jgi:hypothetical protein
MHGTNPSARSLLPSGFRYLVQQDHFDSFCSSDITAKLSLRRFGFVAQFTIQRRAYPQQHVRYGNLLDSEDRVLHEYKSARSVPDTSQAHSLILPSICTSPWASSLLHSLSSLQQPR